jgi:hypothetical protein
MERSAARQEFFFPLRPAAVQRARPEKGFLVPSATRAVLYACNLPAPRSDGEAGAQFATDPSGAPLKTIAQGTEAEFTLASLPGGQVEMVCGEGELATIRFRWLCLSAHASIGAVWRCFAQKPGRSTTAPWMAIDADYMFEACGSLLNAVEMGKLVLPGCDGIALVHPAGALTSFPCPSGRIKITRLSADGSADQDRSAMAAWTGRGIEASVSDGARTDVA